jgi:hypothetical protein
LEGGSDLVWMSDSQPRGAECFGILHQVDRPEINARGTVVFDALLRAHHVVGAVDPNHVHEVRDAKTVCQHLKENINGNGRPAAQPK